MKRRLYLPPSNAEAVAQGRVLLAGEAAHYLHRVLRLRAGEPLGLFDGRGTEWRAILAESTPRHCIAEIQQVHRVTPPPTPLILVQSWLKGSSMDRVAQKATELGVTGLWLLAAERSTVRPGRSNDGKKLAHLHKVVISAAQQCDSLWLPDVETYAGLAAVLESSPSLLRILLDPNQPPLTVDPRPVPLMLLIGPEGGWSDAERTLAHNDPQVTVMGLGELVLRAETAPIAALAAIRHSWGWHR